MADAPDSKSGPRKGVWVQVPPSVLLPIKGRAVSPEYAASHAGVNSPPGSLLCCVISCGSTLPRGFDPLGFNAQGDRSRLAVFHSFAYSGSQGIDQPFPLSPFVIGPTRAGRCTRGRIVMQHVPGANRARDTRHDLDDSSQCRVPWLASEVPLRNHENRSTRPQRVTRRGATEKGRADRP